MTDILGKEIVDYEEAMYLRDNGFNWCCTGYYHIIEDDESYAEYECVGWRGLFRNSYSLWRVAAPSKKACKLWYSLHSVKPFESLTLGLV